MNDITIVIFIIVILLILVTALYVFKQKNEAGSDTELAEELVETKAELERLRNIPIFKSDVHMVLDGEDIEEYKNKSEEEIQHELLEVLAPQLKDHVIFKIEEDPILGIVDYSAEIVVIGKED